MLEKLPDDVQAGLDAARERAARSSRRLQVRAGRRRWPVLRMWEDGFAMAADRAEGLRGAVDLYDGKQHLGRHLIVASAVEENEIRFEFKRLSHGRGEPAPDFAPDAPAPSGLLPG